MKNIPFYIVDVFTEKKYAGNQLAVVRCGDRLTSEEMQLIAREMNYSETTFITSESERDGGYDVRIFTPVREIPFAGHPTLGTAYIIKKEIQGKGPDTVALNLGVGQIPVTFSGSPDSVLWMRQKEPRFGAVVEKSSMAEVLSLSAGDIDDRFPSMDVSTGLPFVIAPLASLDAVKRARFNQTAFDKIMDTLEARAVLLFCAEPYDENNDLNARVFVDYYGIPEDPATGSANGCLAAWLVKHRYFGSDSIDIKVEQGCEIERPSLLMLKAAAAGGSYEINVGGKAVMTARGELL